MSNAWETTTDDVESVLIRMGIKGVSEEKLEEMLEEIMDFHLNYDKVEAAALHGVKSLAQQTDYAYEEIEAQLKQTSIMVWLTS